MVYPYLNYRDRDDLVSGGVKLIPVETPKGTFRVWTKRIGNHPTKKVLLLHGGPGVTHESLETFDGYFPAAEIEYYYYDQLGSHYSDQPDDPELWELGRFVEEVEQVRQARGLDSSNFFLFGLSWGGILALEYALKYQQHLKGLIISNIMASMPKRNAYFETVLKPAMDPDAVAEIERLEAMHDFANPRYRGLVIKHFYEEHMLRMPFAMWPEPMHRALRHWNRAIAARMWGTSALGPNGPLAAWDRTGDLPRLTVPTLTIGATYDEDDPAHMAWMASQVQRGRYLHCNGSHGSIFDDPQTYFEGMIKFINDVDAGRL